MYELVEKANDGFGTINGYKLIVVFVSESDDLHLYQDYKSCSDKHPDDAIFTWCAALKDNEVVGVFQSLEEAENYVLMQQYILPVC